jgi:hypothetical protein
MTNLNTPRGKKPVVLALSLAGIGAFILAWLIWLTHHHEGSRAIFTGIIGFVTGVVTNFASGSVLYLLGRRSGREAGQKIRVQLTSAEGGSFTETVDPKSEASLSEFLNKVDRK